MRVQVFSDAARDCAVRRNSQVGALSSDDPRSSWRSRRAEVSSSPSGGACCRWCCSRPATAAAAAGEEGVATVLPRCGGGRLCRVPGARSTIFRDCETGTTSLTTIWRFGTPRECRPCRGYGRSCQTAATGRLERTSSGVAVGRGDGETNGSDLDRTRLPAQTRRRNRGHSRGATPMGGMADRVIRELMMVEGPQQQRQEQQVPGATPARQTAGGQSSSRQRIVNGRVKAPDCVG